METAFKKALWRLIKGQPILAILPTGGGKSLCFQIPALVNHFRSGGLTIVLSPLQALIKDQVDNLREQTGMHSSIDAIYGLQTGPERGGVYERLHGGDTAILYVSPEQLRNKRFKEAIAKRQISRWVFDEAHCLSKWGMTSGPTTPMREDSSGNCLNGKESPSRQFLVLRPQQKRCQTGATAIFRKGTKSKP